MTGRAPAWLPVSLLFLLLTVAATWPQTVHPAGIPAHRDAWLNLWRLAWIAHALPGDPSHVFDANIYYPARLTLAYSDATLLQGVLAAPFLWLGAATPYMHTALVLGSFLFAGLSAWALVRRLTGSDGAAILSGMVFAFAPYRFDHYMHLELLWTGWMPLTLLALHSAIERQSIRGGLAAGLLLAAQALSCIYYSVMFATAVIPLALVLAAGLPPVRLRRVAIAAGGGTLLAAVVLSAYVAPYRQAREVVGERSEGEAQLYSAGPKHYLAATPDNWLYGRFAETLGRPEKRLFPGAIALVLTVVAIWPPLTRRTVAYTAALLVAVDLSFGPNGVTYEWLREHVFAYRGLRVPARAGAVSLLMFAVLAGVGWARCERAVQTRTAGRGRVVALVLLALAALEYATVPRALIAAPIEAAPVYSWLANPTEPGAVVEFPLPDEHALPGHDAEFMYQSTFHWRPLVNGYSGHVPDAYIQWLRGMKSFPGRAAVEQLRRGGVRYVVVHERLCGSEAYRTITTGLDASAGVSRRAAFGGAGDEVAVYSVDPSTVHD